MNGVQGRGKALKHNCCVDEWFYRFAGSFKIKITMFNISIILGLKKTFLQLYTGMVWTHMKKIIHISQSCESSAQTPGKLFQKVNVKNVKSKIISYLKRQDWRVVPKGRMRRFPCKLCQRIVSHPLLKLVKEMTLMIVTACLLDSSTFLPLLWPHNSPCQNILP